MTTPAPREGLSAVVRLFLVNVAAVAALVAGIVTLVVPAMLVEMSGNTQWWPLAAYPLMLAVLFTYSDWKFRR